MSGIDEPTHAPLVRLASLMSVTLVAISSASADKGLATVASELSISVGNLSVPQLLGQWGSPLIGQGADISLAAHRRERAAVASAAPRDGRES